VFIKFLFLSSLCLLIVFVLCLVYPMLPVSLDCLRPVSCLPNVACVSGLSSSCVLFTQCCLCLWVTLGKQDTGQRQTRDTCNIGHKTQTEDNPETQATLGTRHRTKTNKIKMQQKTKKMINTDTTKYLGVNPGDQQLSSFSVV
jgi:hypothetical protein